MATRTISNTGGNFNSTSTWVESAVPTSADTVVATSTSGQLTVNVASSAGALILTAYTNTLTMSSTLSVYGNITLGSGMTIAGSSSLNLVSSACTFTSNSKTWTTPITFPSISSTITLNGDLTVTGLITFPNVVTTTTINGSNLNINGSLTHNNGNTVQGTSAFVFGGTGTFTSNAIGYYINNPLTINTTGTTTFAGSVIHLGGNFAYSAGTVNIGTTDIAFKNNININPNGLSFNSVYFIAGGTINLLSDLIARGDATLGTTANATLNGRNFYIGGNLFISNNATIKGSTNFILNGTGTWSANATGIIQNNLNINTTGTTTIAGTVYYNTGTLSYSAGTVITTGSTLNCILSTTLNTNGINFENIIFGGTSQTFTLLSDLTLTGLLTLNGATTTTFSGAYNVYLGNGMTINNASHTVTSNSLAKPTFIINNTLTWTHASTSQFGCNLTIDCGANTFSIGSGIGLRFGSSVSSELKYISGTINSTNKSLLLFSVVTVNTTSSVVWNNITMTGSITITLASDLYCSGQLTHNTNDATINGTGFYIYTGGYTKSTSGNLTGTISGIVFNGTGSWTDGFNSTVSIPFFINTSGTLTIGTVYKSGVLTYVAGTVICNGTLTLTAASTLNLNGDSSPSATTTSSTGVNLNNLTTTATGTHTVTGNIRICGTHTAGAGGFNSGANIYNSGTYTVNSNTGAALYNYIMDGTGTITTTGSIRHNLTFNTTGTITFTSLDFGGTANQVLTYVPNTGTINAGTLIIGRLGPATTLNTNSLVFSTVQFQTCLIITTLNSTLNCTNCNFLIGATFAGTGGINADNFNCSVAGSSITLKNGVTYTVNSSLNLNGTASSPVQLKSSTASSYAYFNLSTGATCDVKFCNATDIDSSGGRLITDVKGTLTRTINWYKTNPDYFAFF